MSDWIVKVQTQTGYVKDVEVKDYIYPEDAVKAAINQSGAKRCISFQPSFEQNQDSDSSYTPMEVGGENREWGPKYTSEDKLQSILMMFGCVFLFVVFPPLGILMGVALLIKAIKVNSR